MNKDEMCKVYIRKISKISPIARGLSISLTFWMCDIYFVHTARVLAKINSAKNCLLMFVFATNDTTVNVILCDFDFHFQGNKLNCYTIKSRLLIG